MATFFTLRLVRMVCQPKNGMLVKKRPRGVWIKRA